MQSESALQTAKSEGVSLAAAANRSQAEAESRVTQAKSEAAKSKAEADRLRAEVDKLKGDLDKADKAKAELRSTLDKGTHSEAASQTALQAQIERLRADVRCQCFFASLLVYLLLLVGTCHGRKGGGGEASRVGARRL